MNAQSENDWQSLRKDFPVVQNYTYLDTASSGAISKRTTDCISNFFLDQLHHAAVNRKNWLDKIASARERAAELLGTQPDQIGFTTDVSAGMNFIADRVNPEKEIVLIKDDFPSVNIPWVTRGFKIQWIEKEPDQSISIDKISDAVSSGGKVLALSWVQYNSGFAIDLKEISEICQTSETLLIVDGTQGVGALPISLSELNIDVLIASSFKWQGAGYGISLYYENKHSKFSYPIKLAGWNSLKRFSGELTPENLKTNAPAIEAGHAKYVSLFALDESLKLMQEIGLSNIYNRNKMLSDRLTDKLREADVKFHSPTSENNSSTIICVKATDELYHSLEKENIKVTRRDDYIRFSVHFYNNEKDIDYVMEVLNQVADK